MVEGMWTSFVNYIMQRDGLDYDTAEDIANQVVEVAYDDTYGEPRYQSIEEILDDYMIPQIYKSIIMYYVENNTDY